MMRKLLLLVITLSLISGSLSCGAEKSDVSGTYLCTQGSKDYDKGNILELKKDGTLYVYAPGESGVSGEWKLDGDEIYLIFEFFGLTWKGNIKGDTISLEEGSIWVKEKQQAMKPTAPAPAPTPTSEPADFELWAEAAITWAQNNLGSRHWYELCLRFTANAFMQQGDPPAEIPEGTWTSALDAVNGDEDFDLILKESDSWRNTPRGALIFFGKTEENQFGHVGIYLGDGRIIHSYGKVRIDDVEQVGKLDQGRLIGSYLGWAYPPARWRPKGTTSAMVSTPEPTPPPTQEPSIVKERGIEGVYTSCPEAVGKLKVSHSVTRVFNESSVFPEPAIEATIKNISDNSIEIGAGNKYHTFTLKVISKDETGKPLGEPKSLYFQLMPKEVKSKEVTLFSSDETKGYEIIMEYKNIPQITGSYIESPEAEGKIDVNHYVKAGDSSIALMVEVTNISSEPIGWSSLGGPRVGWYVEVKFKDASNNVVGSEKEIFAEEGGLTVWILEPGETHEMRVGYGCFVPEETKSYEITTVIERVR